MCITLTIRADCIGFKQDYAQNGVLGIYSFPLLWVRKTPSVTPI